MKRALDVSAATVLLVVLSPLLLLIAVAIRLTSAGPIIFRQTRVGKDGAPFTLLKFRSMYADADTQLHLQHMQDIIRNSGVGPGANATLKMAADPRVTPFGRFLRRTSLDELPQLWNVLTGEMSLVGPRPPLPYEVEFYQPWQRRRLEILPGITGLWQVKARNAVSFDENVRLDIYYAEHYSIWLDLQILFMTPLAMIRGAGAG